MGTSKAARARNKIKPGEWVLISGGTPAGYPCHWWWGEVIWADASDVLVGRAEAGRRWREVVPISHVRAAGSVAQLLEVKQAASEGGVREQQMAVTAAEQALAQARDNLWAKLDELAGAGLAVFPTGRS